MRVFSVLFIAIFISATPLYSQSLDESPTYIYVSDKSNNTILVGADITITSGNSIIKGTASKYDSGYATFARFKCEALFKDSVNLNVAHIGYKPFTKNYSAEEFNGHIDVKMQADELVLSEIVVVGNSVAMIIKGDTTVYNAATFKTMEGDRFAELLKQLPGIEIRSNKIYAGEEEIKRVYVDGKNLFGSSTSFSLTDLGSKRCERGQGLRRR